MFHVISYNILYDMFERFALGLTHIKWDVIISSSLRLLLKSVNLTQISKYKIIITMMENSYKKVFIKNVDIKMQSKKLYVSVSYFEFYFCHFDRVNVVT